MPRGTGGRWGGAAGSGSVSSVGLTVPTGLSVTGSPVTGTGTLALAYSSDWPAHYMIVGPASGAATTPTRRQLIHSELSALNADDHSAVYVALAPAQTDRNAVIIAADVTGGSIQANASQTENLYEYRNSSGTMVSGVSPAGSLITTVGTAAPVTTPDDGALHVDTNANRLYVRSGGAWKYTALS